MVQYATADDLGKFMHRTDLDVDSANLALQTASQLFSTRAATMFVPTTVTYQVIGQGYWQLYLPFRPIISIQQVRIISNFSGQTTTQTVTDYSRIKTVMYRMIGFGAPGMFPPDMVEIDLTHGLTETPDDVKGMVLETAASAYDAPVAASVAEAIDDYSVRTAPNLGGMQLTASARELADMYRGTYAA